MGTTELLIVFGILLLLFGSSQLPKLARSLGKSVAEIKQAMSGDESPPLPPEHSE